MEKTTKQELLAKLKSSAKKSNWREDAIERKEANVSNYSKKIAIRILRELRVQKMSQKKLAELIEVTPQQVNKWVKGNENFKLDTIEKIEGALNIKLLQVNLVPEIETEKRDKTEIVMERCEHNHDNMKYVFAKETQSKVYSIVNMDFSNNSNFAEA